MLDTVFMGTPDFTIGVLKEINKFSNLKAIYTAPDKKGKRGKKTIINAPKKFAINNDILLFQPSSFKNNIDEINNMNKINFDLLIVFAYGFILPNEILNIPKIAPINIHLSLLPKYRGCSPVYYSLLNSDKETGVSIQIMNDKVDEGDIVLQKKMKIDNDDNYETLLNKLCKLAEQNIEPVLTQFENKQITRMKQGKAPTSYCKKIIKEDALIKFHETVENNLGKIKAYVLWPKAYTFLKGQKLIIYDAKIISHNIEGKIGEVLKADKNGLFIQFINGILSISKLQLEYKKILDYKSFINGNNINVGDVLGK